MYILVFSLIHISIQQSNSKYNEPIDRKFLIHFITDRSVLIFASLLTSISWASNLSTLQISEFHYPETPTALMRLWEGKPPMFSLAPSCNPLYAKHMAYFSSSS